MIVMMLIVKYSEDGEDFHVDVMGDADPEVHSRLGPAIFCSQRCSLEPRIRRTWMDMDSSQASPQVTGDMI